MVATVSELLEVLDLEHVDDDIFRGLAPDSTLQRVFGGQVLAQSLVAAARTVPEGRYPHSLHGYFLRAGDPDTPIVYVAERTRDGGSFTTRRVIARQHGKAIFHMTTSFQVDEEGLEHQDQMPEVPDPDPAQMPSLADRIASSERDVSPDEWSVIDARFAHEDGPVQRVWMRVNGEMPDDRMTHAAALAYASDLTLLGTALWSHGIGFGRPGLQSASLDHALWFHRPVRTDEWMLFDQHTPNASGSRGIATGKVFSRDGRLVATAVQEGLMRVIDGRKKDG